MPRPDRFAPHKLPLADLSAWSIDRTARFVRRLRQVTWIVRLAAAVATVLSWRDVVIAIQLCESGALPAISPIALCLAFVSTPIAALLAGSRWQGAALRVAVAGFVFSIAAAGMTPRNVPRPGHALLTFGQASVLWLVACACCAAIASAWGYAALRRPPRG